jgi:orotate phosphoribosyltransferase
LTPLFQLGHFILHSGEVSDFKVECDALSESDWQALAKLIATRCSFGAVVGIPRGGLALANQLQGYITRGPGLVVDDVWTTGRSMRPYLDAGYVGYVVFARAPIQDRRARALFTLDA